MYKNVLVVGMPRSGTSLTASIFTKCGYFVAENTKEELRPGDEYNPSGYWEAKSLITANAEIFSLAGFQHNNTWLFDPITEAQAKNISSLKAEQNHKNLVASFNKNSPWIWKDPRLCYTLGYWWPLLNNETTGVLLLKRKPDEIYNSFIKLKWRNKNNKNKTDVFNRIENHIAAAEHAIELYNIPHIAINYSDYNTIPDETVTKLNDFFGLDINSSHLGYNHKLNSHTFRGKTSKLLDSLADKLPRNFRGFVKKILPTFILKIINPNRYSK